jgi:predicted NAD/FAD-dependent oxidoreductase
MCGDHVGSATLNGAIESGVRVAKDIVEKISN